MADKSITADRRSFLSVAGAIGAVAALPAFATTNPRAAWDAAMAQYIKARDAAAAHLTGAYEQVWARYKQWDDEHVGEFPGVYSRDLAAWKAKSDQNPHSDAYDFVDEEHDRLLEIESDAQGALMATPAPDRAALRYKLDYVLDARGGSNDSFSADFLVQTIADYRRLLGEV